jgi:hypothetical protein
MLSIMGRALVLVVLLLGTNAVAEEIGGRVVDTDGTPVAQATVSVGGGGWTRTGADGRFKLKAPSGPRELVVQFGTVEVKRVVDVLQDKGAQVTLRIDLAAASEVYVIKERPMVPAEPTKPYDEIELPFSDEAILEDRWKVGWVLLFIDREGRVDGVRFLKRPSADLDEIAVNEALKWRFKPALDGAGKPVASVLLWKMEWKSYFRHRVLKNPTNTSVLCEGSGPLNLGSMHPTYRDCSRPDWAKAYTEPTYHANGRVSPAEVKPGQRLDDRSLRRPELCTWIARNRLLEDDATFSEVGCARELTVLARCPAPVTAYISCKRGERSGCAQLDACRK